METGIKAKDKTWKNRKHTKLSKPSNEVKTEVKKKEDKKKRRTWK